MKTDARTRNGKIARLPAAIREQLNLRLENNEDGTKLLTWLNALAETKKILRDLFNNVPVSKQNLSEWRNGGFREWQTRRDLLAQAGELSEHAQQLEDTCDWLLVDNVATVLAARYAALLAAWDIESPAKFTAQLRVLSAMSQDIVRLQRSMHRAVTHNLELEQAQEEADKREIKEAKAQAIAQVLAPLRNQTRAEVYGGGKVGEYLAEAIDAIQNDRPVPDLPESPDSGQPGQAQSNPVKPKKSRKRQPSPDTSTASGPPPTPFPVRANAIPNSKKSVSEFSTTDDASPYP